jgi:hypothetical protein
MEFLMSDEEILSTLVKGRERCRQLVQFYHNVRAASAPDGTLPRLNDISLETANRILAQVLAHLRSLPKKPSEFVQNGAKRLDAERLLREIGDLIEKAMVAEREMREKLGARPSPPTGTARSSALRMYSAAGQEKT